MYKVKGYVKNVSWNGELKTVQLDILTKDMACKDIPISTLVVIEPLTKKLSTDCPCDYCSKEMSCDIMAHQYPVKHHNCFKGKSLL